MTKTCTNRPRSARACSRTVIALGALMASTSALGQTTQTGVIVSADAGAAVNPFLSDDESSNDIVGTFDLRVQPWLKLRTARDEITVSAFAAVREYTSNFDLEDSEGAEITYRSQRSGQLALYGSAGITSSSARSIFPSGRAFPGVTDPINPDDPTLPDPLQTAPDLIATDDDITLLGLNGRSTTIDVNSGLEYRIDGRSFVGTSLRYQNLSVSEDSLSGYDAVSATASYSRSVSARTKLGVLGGARFAEFDNGVSTDTYFGEAVVERQLNAEWTVSGSAGVFTVDTDAGGLFPDDSQTGISASADLCSSRVDRQICFNARRAPRPGSLGRVETLNAVGFSASQRLSPDSRLGVSASYARSRSEFALDEDRRTLELVRVQANYSRTLSQRLDGYVYAGVGRSYGDIFSNNLSANVGVGVSLRLGRNR